MISCAKSWTPSRRLGSSDFTAEKQKPFTAETQRRRGKRREHKRGVMEMRPFGERDGSERFDSRHHRGCDRSASRSGPGAIGVGVSGSSLLRAGSGWPFVSAPGSDPAQLQRRSVELRVSSGFPGGRRSHCGNQGSGIPPAGALRATIDLSEERRQARRASNQFQCSRIEARNPTNGERIWGARSMKFSLSCLSLRWFSLRFPLRLCVSAVKGFRLLGAHS